MHIFSNVLIIVVLAFLVVAFGCSENRGLTKVAGIITCDGKEPPATGSMRFIPEPGQTDVRGGAARFDKDGKFAASTWEKGDGLRPGKYKICFECWEESPSLSGSKGVSLIDRKYTDWNNDSAMPRLEVVAGTSQTDIVFDVELATEPTIRAERAAHQKAEANAQKAMMP